MSELIKRQEFSFLWESKAPFKAVVAARGSGKTFASIQYVLERLLTGKPNSQAIFFSSTLSQVRGTVEPYMRLLTANFPKKFYAYNVSNHKYSFYFSKSDVRELRLSSYERGSRERGYHPDFIILDEAAEMPANMWGNVILPMLTDQSSQLLAIGTPRGYDKFYELFSRGLSKDFPEWESYAIKASEHPNLFPPEQLAIKRNNQTVAEYVQEYECDFKANVFVGSVYMEYIRNFTTKNISNNYIWDPNLPVYTAWDIGFTDYTAIWFFQKNQDVITFIDYLEDNGQLVPFYAQQINQKPYFVKTCFLPHDGAAGNIRGHSVADQLRKLGLTPEIVANEREQYGVDQARILLTTARFNANHCELGLKRLKNYKYRLDKKTYEKVGFLHDDNSHGADAFRYAALAIKSLKDNGSLRVQKHVNFSAFR